jgi:small subunit ribosomal protein S8
VDSKNFVSVGLKYFDGQPVIKNLERISRPGLRKYEGVKDLKEVNAGLGIYILTTNQGLMTDKTARSQNIGGEVLVRIF